MELVINEEQVAENLAELDRARQLMDGDGKTYRDLIRKGTCYLPYLTDTGIAFAPSRFLDNAGNRLPSHGSNREKHGSDTNVALNKSTVHTRFKTRTCSLHSRASVFR